MSDRIYLEDVVVTVRVGAGKRERGQPQPIRFSIVMDCDLQAAGRSDQLTDTLNYVKAYETLVRVAQSRPFALLEALCERVAEELLALKAEAVLVKASKERNPIPGMQGRVAVEIQRRRPRIE
ncbi:MAG TPA: dihydroneopterin aldolase [bacterium]|nr:dihydroneopterin aldolase [Candidatus Omnitrophota bacterium]HOJ59259.1 dihydroneopterin aldolase [bacterium]HPP02095.1 dihydroneopterin aldolase [bacterium]HXK95702.1 dihydroneopterin aldolase [bacterium]